VIVDFIRPGEDISDAQFTARIVCYYRYLRAGVPQADALARALTECVEVPTLEPEVPVMGQQVMDFLKRSV